MQVFVLLLVILFLPNKFQANVTVIANVKFFREWLQTDNYIQE